MAPKRATASAAGATPPGPVIHTPRPTVASHAAPAANLRWPPAPLLPRPASPLRHDVDAAAFMLRALSGEPQEYPVEDHLEPPSPPPSPSPSPSPPASRAQTPSSPPGSPQLIVTFLDDAPAPGGNAEGAGAGGDGHGAPAQAQGAGNRSQRGKRKRRAARRAAEREDPSIRKVRSSAMRYAAKASVLPTPEPVQLKRMAKGCFVAVRHRVGSRRLSRLDELRAQGFTVYDWDGVTTQAILDGADRIVGVLAGRPEDPAWDGVVREANIAMHRARRRCRFRRPDVAHRRGSYPTLARGVSFGGGQRAPHGLKNSAGNASALSDLCADPAMRRIAGFGNHILATYAPKIYRHMNAELGKLLRDNPDLRRPFNTSMYPAASFNFGPNSVCFEHTDSLNDPCNWIHITALGTFNPDKGGHLILYDLRLVIRFPPGSSILFPSALLRHGNLAVAGHEHRMSFTQYCAGGLMRWVACGGQTVASLKKNDPAGYAAYQASLSKRAGQCMARFSTPASLLQDIKGSGSN